jgi:glyoxylase-like metal-dependent hydrolase (beta-lactamase superfamily II)/rhodanese-related sulfurtransferase
MMILKQYYLGCLAHASYLIADESTGDAAIVDPQRDIDQYLADAKEHNLTIRYVILTHFHADFLAGHIELRNRAGATIVLGSKAQAEFEFLAVTDGQTLTLGEIRLQILETPGHTPEGISLLVFSPQPSDSQPSDSQPSDSQPTGPQPYAVLTGDTLFIGDVGRPDLLASIGVTAEELAEMLYASIDRLRKLPDATLVYPAHGAGSMCGKNLSKETVSTIGEQKKFNYAMQPMSLETFKALVTADQPEAPDYFVYDAILNRKERTDLDANMQKSLRKMSVEEVLEAQQHGAQLLDVREGADFEGAYLAGSLQIGLQGKYATWCGSLLDHQLPIVVIAEPGDEPEAVMRLGRIGFDNIAGYLEGGMSALENHPNLVKSIDRITAPALARLLESSQPPLVLDVRSDNERSAAHVAGSLHIPLAGLAERIGELPEDRLLVVHCEGGYRSAIACSLLARSGRTKLMDLVGGIKAWQASQLPIEGTPSSCSVGSTSCSR